MRTVIPQAKCIAYSRLLWASYASELFLSLFFIPPLDVAQNRGFVWALTSFRPPPPSYTVLPLQAAVATKFSATAPSDVSLFFPNGVWLDDDDTVEVRGFIVSVSLTEARSTSSVKLTELGQVDRGRVYELDDDDTVEVDGRERGLIFAGSPFAGPLRERN